jgi:pyruvate dehydrogenase E1 component alpha subunit
MDLETRTKQELIQLEKDIKELYLSGRVLAPVHLVGGNEEQLLEIFKKIKMEDWVFSTHRSHYHAFLKGVPAEQIKSDILEGRSIRLNYPEYYFFTSSIVGGILPIAMGTAYGLKLKNSPRHVWAFVGDMASEMGAFHESAKYARRHNFPITFVIEDNGVSVDTPTQKVWGEEDRGSNIIHYTYERTYPHHGSGQWVNFPIQPKGWAT